MADSGFSIIAECRGGVWRLAVAGEIDLTSGSRVLDAAEALAFHQAADVRIDLAGVTFIDSSGWRAVESARALLELAGASCTVERPSPAVRRVTRLLSGHPAGAGLAVARNGRAEP